jgi:broad specificity phosphatase PhoE
MPTRVLLIRHGETAWNITGRWQGHAPVPLNETGVAQSLALSRYLARNGFRIDVIYTSDLKRAVQTAVTLSDALSLPILTDARLREVDLGAWQGLTREETEAWDPDRYAAFRADLRHNPTPDGESRLDLQCRARAAFDDIVAAHPGQTAAVISHGGPIGMLLESLFGPIERPSLTNTSVTVVEQESPGALWQLVHVGWAPHLAESPPGEPR